MNTKLYIVKLQREDDIFIKVGKSNNLNRRLKHFSTNHYCRVLALYDDTTIDWGEVEKAVHSHFKSYKYIPDIALFSGNTELYPITLLDEIIKFIEYRYLNSKIIIEPPTHCPSSSSLYESLNGIGFTSGQGFIVKSYISRIAKVRFIDSQEEINIPHGAKDLYCKLMSYGHSCGYNSIYENQDKLAYDLGVSEKTVRNWLATLNRIGLVYSQKHKDKTKFDSNSYWLKRPNMINRVQWLDVNGDVLKGKDYRFNRSQFNKPIEDCNKDRLLKELILYVRDNQAETTKDTFFGVIENDTE